MFYNLILTYLMMCYQWILQATLSEIIAITTLELTHIVFLLIMR